MPLVEIFVSEARPASDRKKLADAVHQALVQAVSIPEGDRFQLVRTLSAADVFIDATYLGLTRTPDFVVVRVTLRRGRSNAIKRALYAAVAKNAAAAVGIRPEDVLILLTENDAADWSFGAGLAQYALEN
jgi:phenylpyruvate tautomerase PptA (4-oxalocrotonate tautomerase family)